MRDSAFFRDISVNLALRLYKTHEKYAKNAMKLTLINRMRG